MLCVMGDLEIARVPGSRSAPARPDRYSGLLSGARSGRWSGMHAPVYVKDAGGV